MNTYNWNLKFPKCNAVFPGRKRQRPYGKHISPFSALSRTAIPQSHIWRKVYDYLPDTAPLIKSGTTCKKRNNSGTDGDVKQIFRMLEWLLIYYKICMRPVICLFLPFRLQMNTSVNIMLLSWAIWYQKICNFAIGVISI